VREAQTHHEIRREALRAEHVRVYEHFENVHAELDALAGELARVASTGVSLGRHFERFGFDARVRAYDDEGEGASGSATPRSSFSAKRGEEGEGPGKVEPLRMFKVPVMRQYFHKGVLWRSSRAEEVMSFELFIDCACVVSLFVWYVLILGSAVRGYSAGHRRRSGRASDRIIAHALHHYIPPKLEDMERYRARGLVVRHG